MKFKIGLFIFLFFIAFAIFGLTPKEVLAAPTTAISNSGSPNGAGWYKSSINITLTCTKGAGANSNPCTTKYSICNYAVGASPCTPAAPATTYSGNFSLQGPKQYIISYASTDSTGIEATKTSGTYKVDQDNPTFSPKAKDSSGNILAPDPITSNPSSNNPAPWYTQNVNVFLNCADFSGCTTITYCLGDFGSGCTPNVTYNPAIGIPNYTGGNRNETKIRYSTADVAGNTIDKDEIYYKVDTDVPTTSYQASGTAGATGWFISSVDLSIKCSDPSNNCNQVFFCNSSSTCTPSATGTSDFSNTMTVQGNRTVKYYSVDDAGNQGPLQTKTFGIDTTNPTLNAIVINEFNSGTSKQITLSCSDNISCSLTYCLSTSFSTCTPDQPYSSIVNAPSNSKSITYKAIDPSGRNVSKTSPLIINWGGQPETCAVRVYKDDANANTANKTYLVPGNGNKGFTVNVGETYYLEYRNLRSSFWHNCGSNPPTGCKHSISMKELDPYVIDSRGNTFYNANGIDPNTVWIDGDGNGHNSLGELERVPYLGTWESVDDPTFVDKLGPWRWKYTPTTSGQTVLFARLVNTLSVSSSNGQECQRTTGITAVYVSPPGPFNIASVTAGASCPASVNVTWTQSAGADRYEVWRAGGGASSQLITSINNPNTLGYNDTSVAPNQGYTYFIYAYKNAGGQPATTGWSSPFTYTPVCGTQATAPIIDLEMVVGSSIGKALTIDDGTVVTLQWTTKNLPTTCTASSANPSNPQWTGPVGTNPINSKNVGALLYANGAGATQSFTLTCSNGTLPNAVDSVTATVKVPPPKAYIQTKDGDVHSNDNITGN